LLLFRYLASVRTFTSKLCRSSRQWWKTGRPILQQISLSQKLKGEIISSRKNIRARENCCRSLWANFARIPRHYISFVSVGYIENLFYIYALAQISETCFRVRQNFIGKATPPVESKSCCDEREHLLSSC